MKILARQSIEAAQNSGTVWYKITKDQIIEGSLWGKNSWIKARIEWYPLSESLNLQQLDGSFILDDTLYLMVSDYLPIIVRGQEIEPDEVVDQFELDDISEYINDNPGNEILRNITDSDISWDGIDIEEFAKELLDFESLSKIAEDADEIGLIELS